MIFVKLLQPENAVVPTLVRLSGRSILVKLRQFANAELPILVAFVIVTFFKEDGI